MKYILFLLTFSVFAFSGFTLQAQEVTKKWKDAFMSQSFQLYGYGQTIGNISQHPERGMVQTTSNNSIDIARVILFGIGRFGAEKQFGYMVMYDFGPNSCLHELYGEWLPSDAFNLRFGQYKIPFTIENPMSPTVLETVYYSRSVSAMAGSVGDFNQFRPGGAVYVKGGRDAGLQLSGKTFQKDDFFLLEYYAGLFNGIGLNTKDNDNHKDFIGTVYLQPIKGLKIGGSVYSGKITMTDTIGGLLAGNHIRNAWTLGAVFNSKHFYARSEYVANRTGNIDRQGYYASLTWKFVPDKWEVLGKYDFYDADKSVSLNETNDITFGINYYLAYRTRIQLNYIYTDDKVRGKNNAVATQLQLYF
jgi:hypothetical protein